MKSLFFTFALLLCGASVFAANDILHPETEDNAMLTMADATIVDDEICFSASVNVGGQIGPLSVGATIQVSGCGETAAEAWADFLDAMSHITEQ